MLINHHVCKKSLGELDPDNALYYLDPTQESSRGGKRLHIPEDKEIETPWDRYCNYLTAGLWMIAILCEFIVLAVMGQETSIEILLSVTILIAVIYNIIHKRKPL